MSSKETNPKDAVASNKVPLGLVSPILKAQLSTAMAAGLVKYGAWNFRVAGAKAMVYVDAAHRHLDRWQSGQEYDPVDGTHHLANAAACVSIILECIAAGNLVDDRPPSIDLTSIYAQCEAVMSSLRIQYADKDPRHYTIADTLPEKDQ